MRDEVKQAEQYGELVDQLNSDTVGAGSARPTTDDDAELAELVQLAAGFKTLANPMPPADTQRVQTKLTRALSPRPSSPDSRTPFRLIGLAAAAMVAIAVIGLVIVVLNTNGGATGQSLQPAATKAASPAPTLKEPTITTQGSARASVVIGGVTPTPATTPEATYAPTNNLYYNFPRSSAAIRTVAFSPDGTKLLTGGDDKIVQLHDLQAKTVINLVGHTDTVTSVKWSPDGKYFLTAGDNSVWRYTAKGSLLGTGTLVNYIANSPPPPVYLAWSPDSQMYAVSVYGGVQLNDIDGLRKILSKDPAGDLAYSPDGKYLAVANATNGKGKIYTADGQEVAVLADASYGVAWSPNSQTVLSSNRGGTVLAWNSQGQPLPNLLQERDGLLRLAYSPDGKYIAIASTIANTVRLWTADGQLVRQLPLEQGEVVFDVAWSPEGKRLATVSNWYTKVWSVPALLPPTPTVASGGVLPFNIKTTQLAQLDAQTKGVRDLAYSPDSKLLATVGQGDTAQLWDAKTGKLLKTLLGPGPVGMVGAMGATHLHWSPDGHMLAVGYSNGQCVGAKDCEMRGSPVRLWAASGELKQEFTATNSPIYQLAWSPDSQFLTTAHYDQKLRVWNRAGQLLESHDLPVQYASQLAYSPDGKYMAIAMRDYAQPPNIQLQIRTPAGSVISTYSNFDQPITALAWSPQYGALAVSVGNNVRLYLQPASSNKIGQAIELPGHKGAVQTLAWSPDGNRLASGSLDNSVILWSNQGARMDSVTLVKGYVNSVAWSPDSRILALGGEDTAVWLYDITTKSYNAIGRHDTAISLLMWSPDGSQLASGAMENYVKLWSIKR